MSERINDRWRQLNEVYIPPIRRPGFESNVLKRDIWDQSAAPPDAPVRYAPAADPWETEAPEQIPDDIWEDPVGADAPAKAVPAQAAAPAAEPLQPAVPVFEIPAEPAEPEIFIEPEAPVQPMPVAEEAAAEPAEPEIFIEPEAPVQPEPAPVESSPVEPQPEHAEPARPEPVIPEVPAEPEIFIESAAPAQPEPVIPEVPAEPEIFIEPAAPVQPEPAAEEAAAVPEPVQPEPAPVKASPAEPQPEPAESAQPVQPDPAIDDIFVQQKAPEPDYYEEGTVLLSDGGIRLVRVKDPSEVICVTGDSFILGKSRKADYSIGGNPAISRIHAHIYRIGNDYYIEDRNSLNHTYVDEEMITGPYKLRNGLVIRLANEDFILKMD